MTFIQNLMPIVLFDVLDYFRITEPPNSSNEDTNRGSGRLLSEEQLNIREQTLLLTYDTHIPTKMLRTLGVLIVIWFIRVILFYFIGYIIVRTGRGKSVYESFKRSLFYRDLLFILTEGYLVFVIAFFLKFKSPVEDHMNNWQFICTWFIAFVSFVVIPL